MKKKLGFSLLVSIVALVVALGFTAQPTLAAGHTFDVSVYHNIDGTKLGLSEALPVDIYIYKEGSLFSFIADFTFGERFSASLPEGNYEIKIFSRELGAFVDSMTVGPVDIPGGVEVRMQAALATGGTPTTIVKVNGSKVDLSKAAAAGPADGNFGVSVYHGIKGTRLGLSEALPVDIYIYSPAGLIAYVPNFTFGQRFDTQLPAGNYEIMVYSQELGTFLPSMTIGPVDIPENVEVRLNAQLTPDKTPVINVKVK
jgi:hypothetical protein